MLDEVRARLRRVRMKLARRAEESYLDRDGAEWASHEKSFAEGEAHAYGIAESDIRKEEDRKTDA